MRKSVLIQKRFLILLAISIIYSASFARSAICSVLTVQEQEPKYKYTSKPAESLFIQKSPSVDQLVSNVTAGVTQGVDTNPLLDSSKKVDSYTQELLDVHYKYPFYGSFLGFTDSKFGFNVMNTNYYKVTDVNTMDAIGDVNIEQEIFDKVVVSVGYVFEYMWFPRQEDGTYISNQGNASIKQNITKWLYQKFTYRILSKNFLSRMIRLGNFSEGPDNRFDLRNAFEHELGVYITDKTKVKITNQFYINKSNDQFFDYYNYYNYRFGTSVVHFLTKKLYGIAGFYYQRRNYMERKVSDRDATERDNLYLVTASLLYDITKDISVFINYSHSENHTNEPLEKYSDTVYSGGLYYSF